MDDAGLVRAARNGSVSAFMAIVDRYADPLHDLAQAMLRDQQAAREVVKESFREASQRLHGLTEEDRLSVWLLAVTRRQATLRAGPTAGPDRRPTLPDADNRDRRQVRLVTLLYEAVADLALLDRTLLALEVGHGLDRPDLADVLGVPLSQAQELERRVHDIGEDLTRHLVARLNESGCRSLTRRLNGWDRRLASESFRELAGHIDDCKLCRSAAEALPPALTLYAAGSNGATAAPPSPRIVLKLLPERSPEPEADPAAEPPPPQAAGAAPAAHPSLLAPAPLAPAPGVGAQEAASAMDDTGPEQDGSEPWMPNGFPPPSIPMPDRTSTTTSVRGAVRRRGRWVAAAAAAVAALLLGAALLLPDRDVQNTALRSDSTATSASADASTLPEATTAPSEPVVPLLPTGPVASAPPGSASSAPPAPVSTAPNVAAAPGALSGADWVRLPRVDSTAGTQRGGLPLRNTGSSPLTYGTRSSFAGLSVDKPTGTIGPGAGVELTVTLDGAKAGEGAFSATLTFEGSGGTKQVTVTATVGRPPVIKDDAGEPCTSSSNACSRLVQLVPASSPDPQRTLCNTPWRYSITVEDESRLKAVRAAALQGVGETELKRDGATTGTAGRWQSDVFPPLPAGTARNLAVRAVDEHDFFTARTERTTVC